jgi:hypothetical protein
MHVRNWMGIIIGFDNEVLQTDLPQCTLPPEVFQIGAGNHH